MAHAIAAGRVVYIKVFFMIIINATPRTHHARVNKIDTLKN